MLSLRTYQFPPITAHTHLLDEVYTTISEAITSGDPPDEVIDTLRSDLTTYGDQVIDWAEFYKQYSASEITAKMLEDQSIWRYKDHNGTTIYNDTFDKLRPHAEALRKLAFLLHDKRVSEQVVRFILNPAPGSSVIGHDVATGMPYFFNILPEEYAHDFTITVMDLRYPDGPGSDDEEIDDEVQEELEREFQTQLNKDFLDHTVTKPKLRPFAVPGTTSDPNSTRKKQKKKEKKPATGGGGKGKGPDPESKPDTSPPPGGSSSGGSGSKGNDDVPDDSDYTPDSSLAGKAIEYTKRVRAQDLTDLKHDHMTRFNIKTENPQYLRVYQVKPGDFRVTTSDWTTGQKYIVTYTRKSRKPIFNPYQ